MAEFDVGEGLQQWGEWQVPYECECPEPAAKRSGGGLDVGPLNRQRRKPVHCLPLLKVDRAGR